MTTETKIREAFEKHYGTMPFPDAEEMYPIFRAGYLALLNELEKAGGCGGMDLYYLPEGVTK